MRTEGFLFPPFLSNAENSSIPKAGPKLSLIGRWSHFSSELLIGKCLLVVVAAYTTCCLCCTQYSRAVIALLPAASAIYRQLVLCTAWLCYVPHSYAVVALLRAGCACLCYVPPACAMYRLVVLCTAWLCSLIFEPSLVFPATHTIVLSSAVASDL